MPIDPRTPVGNLGIGQQQLVEIAKALSQEARILVLDEPTAALTESEVETLFTILRKLKARGVGMIYISHKLDEVFKMSDRITVLRDGKTVGTHNAADLTKEKVISLMVGREVGDIFPKPEHEFGETALEVKGLTAYSTDVADKKLVNDVSFSVRRGEVLGIAGLMGAGRTELLMAIFGAWPGKSSGETIVEGKPVKISSPTDAIENGIGFVTEDRKRFGLILEQTIRGQYDARRAEAGIGRLSYKSNKRDEGGAGLDEVAAGKGEFTLDRLRDALGREPAEGRARKVAADKPEGAVSRRADARDRRRGQTGDIREINKLAKEGLAIVLVSSELPEVLGLSDRVLVLHEGKVTGEFTRSAATPEKVMAAATGGE